MKCKSCDGNVLVTWTAALAKNECPFCGGVVIQPEELEFISSLKDALQKMDATAEQIAFWFFENYKLQKIGSGEPVEFKSPKKQKQPQIQADEEVQDTDSSEIFIPARSGAKIPNALRELSAKLDSGTLNVVGGIIRDPIALEENLNLGSDDLSIDDSDSHQNEIPMPRKLTGSGSFRRAK